MVIEARLSKNQFVKLAITRHLQRTTFYFYALTVSAVTAYVILGGDFILLLVAWLPFMLYIILGVMNAFRSGADESLPIFLPTRYTFGEQGVEVSSSAGQSTVEWSQFSVWKRLARCYVLVLVSGQIIAIPEAAVANQHVKQFETLLRTHIGPG